jgi:hypothetical protein
MRSKMAIKIQKVSENLYTASLTLPDVPNVQEEWTTPHPLPGRRLTDELLARGCHQTDIGDAMYGQDPMWVEKLEKEEAP